MIVHLAPVVGQAGRAAARPGRESPAVAPGRLAGRALSEFRVQFQVVTTGRVRRHSNATTIAVPAAVTVMDLACSCTAAAARAGGESPHVELAVRA